MMTVDRRCPVGLRGPGCCWRLLALVVSRWPRCGLKALLVAGVTGLYFSADSDRSTTPGAGRAVQALPERFVLLAVVIEEPTKNTPGALYRLGQRASRTASRFAQPRAYRLPYSKDLHGLLDEGMKKIRQGVSQMGTAEPKSGPRGFSWLRPGSDEQNVKIRDLPVPQLPEK
jgi:hypothetical protein